VRRLVAVVAGGLLLSGCATASMSTPQRSVEVRGQVLDASGAPVSGAEVDLADSYQVPLAVRARTHTDAHGKYDVHASRLSTFGDVIVRISGRDSTAMVRASEHDHIQVPPVRLWVPATQVRSAGPGSLLVSLAPTPYPQASYAVGTDPGVLDDPERFAGDLYAAPSGSVVVPQVGDKVVAVADVVIPGKSPFGVRFMAAASFAGAGPDIVSTGRPCTAWDAVGASRPLDPCPYTQSDPADRPGADLRLLTVDLGSPRTVGAVVVHGCAFFCELVSSTDGRHWTNLDSHELDPASPGDRKVLVPAQSVTTRYVGISPQLGAATFEPLTGPALAADTDDPLETTQVEVSTGHPDPAAERAVSDYRAPSMPVLGVATSHSYVGAVAVASPRRSAGSPLPRSVVEIALLALVAVAAAAAARNLRRASA